MVSHYLERVQAAAEHPTKPRQHLLPLASIASAVGFFRYPCSRAVLHNNPVECLVGQDLGENPAGELIERHVAGDRPADELAELEDRGAARGVA